MEEEFYFQKFQVVCVDFAKNPTETRAKSLGVVLNELPCDVVDKFFPYILFSLQLTLKKCRFQENKISEKTKLLLLENLEILLEKCDFSTKNPSLAADLISDLTCLMDLSESKESANSSEEFLSANLTCLIKILQKANEYRPIKNFLSSTEFRPVLAHLVSCTLKVLLKNCKTLSINCLNYVISLSDSIASSFLPGVCSVLLEILLNSCQNEENFLFSCFQILSDIILAAARDEMNLTEEWRRNAGLQLKNLIDRISAFFVCHSSTKLRFSLAHFVRKILLNDSEILRESKKRSIEVLSALIMDQNMSNSDQDMTDISKIFDNSDKYREEIYANLNAICWRLPRMSKSSQFEVQQRIEWQQFCGCLKLLGKQNLVYFFLNDVQAKRFCRSFCEAIEFNEIVWEFDVEKDLNVDASSSDNKTYLSLRQPSDLYAQKLIFVCFDILADVDELETVLEHFYDVFQSKNVFKSQSAYILNGILNCVQKKNCKYSSDLIENLLDDYLSWLSFDENSSEINVNLALNGIAVASSLIKNEMQSFLVKALFLILRLLDLQKTKQIAFSTLQSIAKSFGSTSAKMLIVNNLDYLTSSIILKLKQLSLNYDAPYVLSAILDVVEASNVDRVRFAVVECLSTVDRCRETNVALPTLLKCLEKFGCLCQQISPPKENLDEEFDENEDDLHSGPKKKTLVWHVQLCVNIINSVQCWLGVQSFAIRVASMEALRENLCALKSYQDHLLPAVHRCWPSVLARLNDVEIPSKLSAFGIIFALARLSGDFVRMRIENEAFPALKTFLTTNIIDCRRAGITYRQSAAFRLQLNVCDTLGELCEKICATNEFVDKCRRLLNMYVLDEHQPKILYEAASKSLNIIEKRGEN